MDDTGFYEINKNIMNTQTGIRNGFRNDINNKLLYRIGMGITDRSTPDVESVITWDEDFNDYFHQYSYKRVLYEYGYYELEKYFGTITQYLDTTNTLKRLVITNVAKGKQDAEKERNRIAKEVAKQEAEKAKQETKGNNPQASLAGMDLGF